MIGPPDGGTAGSGDPREVSADALPTVWAATFEGVQGYLLGRPSETLPDATTLEGLGPLAQIS